MTATGLVLHSEPRLRNPAMIAAFADWNDAGEAASAAVRWLVKRLPGKRFASIEAEHYHIFTTSRPTVRITGGERTLSWPLHDAFLHTDPELSRDLVLLVGREPQTHWRTYCETVVELAQRAGVTTLVTLGAFLGETTHTRPVPLSGFATAAPLRERLDQLGIARSNYEGPSGITATVPAFAREAGLDTASLWAAIPQYLPTTANPKAALALVRAVAAVLDLEFDLRRLEAAAAFFQRQVDKAVAHDRRATGLLRAIERRTSPEPESVVEPTSDPNAALPSVEDIIRDLERFLRRSADADAEND